MSESEVHFMYVVECSDGSLYTGYAVNVEQRIEVHNSGCGAKYTRSRLPVRLVAKACFESKHEAMSAEFHFKRLTRTQKMKMLESDFDSSIRELIT